MTLKNTLFLTILLPALAACSSTATPTQYYQLPNSALRVRPSPNSAAMGIKVRLAEPLKGENIIYQTDAYTIHFAQKNLWAAPLDEMLTAALVNKFTARGESYIPVALSDNPKKLTVYFDRFQGSYTGETEISGFAQWSDGTKRPFYVRTPQNGDGYPAMLDSLNKGLDSVILQITQ